MDSRESQIVLLIIYGMHLATSELPYQNITINNQFYFLSDGTTDATMASDRCSNDLPAELAFFDTNDEYKAVADYLTSYFNNVSVSVIDIWVNLNSTDVNNDHIYEHRWRSQLVDSTIWAHGEPDTCCKKPLNEKCCARMAWSKGEVIYLRDKTCTEASYKYLCKSLNECKPNENICSHICIDEAIGFRCACNKGYTLSSDRTNCDDVDECRSKPCSHKCANLPGSYTCSCEPGYLLGFDHHSCEPVSRFNNTDVHNQLSTNINGTYENHCTTLEKPCQESFVNNNNSKTWHCDTGYILNENNTSCEDVDECLKIPYPCSGPCVNMEGSYFCECMSGFHAVNNSCEDIDECAIDHHNCSQLCVNTNGSYECVCNQGYRISANDSYGCNDVDECMEKTNNCSQICINYDSSYSCTCNEGYNLDVIDQKSCHDINECEEHPHICQHKCANTDGSFNCLCKPGYSLYLDNVSCVQITAPHECPCSCWSLKVRKSQSPQELIKDIEKQQCDMTVDKYKLSSTIRKITSASDNRVSSQTIGGSGIGLIVAFFSLIILSDALNFLRFMLFRNKPN